MSALSAEYASALRSRMSAKGVALGHHPVRTPVVSHTLKTMYRMNGLAPSNVRTLAFVLKALKSAGRRLRYATSIAPVCIASLRFEAVVYRTIVILLTARGVP